MLGLCIRGRRFPTAHARGDVVRVGLVVAVLALPADCVVPEADLLRLDEPMAISVDRHCKTATNIYNNMRTRIPFRGDPTVALCKFLLSNFCVGFNNF
eukprot:scaffold74262_cov31-Prasinocladus_malaysianus.AAC.1